MCVVEVNNKLLGGPGQIGKTQHGRELTKGSVEPEDEARMGVFVLRIIAAQICATLERIVYLG